MHCACAVFEIVDFESGFKILIKNSAAMAGVSRHMARSFVSSARAAGRFCGNKTPTNASGEMGAIARAGLGGAPRSAAPSPLSFSSPKSFVMESRRPGAFFQRLPGEVACVKSLLPLHNATASARMVSQLCFSAGALLQGLWIIDDA